MAVRAGAGIRRVTEQNGIVFSPWHPGAIPRGVDGEPFHATIDPSAVAHGATATPIALAWQLHRTPED